MPALKQTFTKMLSSKIFAIRADMRMTCVGLCLEDRGARVERAELHLEGADEHLKEADGQKSVATRQVGNLRGHVDSARGHWKGVELRGVEIGRGVARGEPRGFQTIGRVLEGVDTLSSAMDVGRGNSRGFQNRQRLKRNWHALCIGAGHADERRRRCVAPGGPGCG